MFQSKSDIIIYKAIRNQQMQNHNLQLKQHYLRQNIIEAGYDPQKFVQFCTQTHDLDDLQNWSMHELVDIVQRFRAQQAKHLPSAKFQSQQVYKQTAKVTTPVVPLPQNKLAINISDQDWTDFLSAPSLLQTPKTNIVPLPTDIVFDFGFGNTNQNGKSNEYLDKSKDIPLSPPSNINKKISQQPTSLPRGLQRLPQIPRTPVLSKSEKTQSKNIKQALPINLSNIKILTAKQKLQPLLPLINDVIVTKTEQVSRNFLQGDYTLYHISFPPTQHVVKRKFADLRKVRSLLQKYYPFLRLPYLQPEGWLGSSQGKDHQILQRYKLMTQQFIKYTLLKSKQLKDCQLVRILCGFSFNGQKDDLKKKIQTLQVASRPKSISDVLLGQNSFLIPPVNSNDILISNTLHIMSQIDIQYDRLRKQLQNLFNVQQTLIKNYSEIATTFETLQNLTKKYNIDNNQPKQQRIYDGFKEMIIKMSTQINRESDIFRAKIRNLFKYEKENMATLKEVFQLRNKIHSEYQRQSYPPFTSNSMRIQGSNVQVQSPIPLQQPIRQNKNTLALQQIFWSFTSSRQINRYWQHLRRRITENLTLIAYDELDSQNQNLNFWNSMIKKCVI